MPAAIAMFFASVPLSAQTVDRVEDGGEALGEHLGEALLVRGLVDVPILLSLRVGHDCVRPGLERLPGGVPTRPQLGEQANGRPDAVAVAGLDGRLLLVVEVDDLLGRRVDGRSYLHRHARHLTPVPNTRHL